MKSSVTTDSKTILLVDDADCMIAYLKKLLTREGYNVITAINGKQAVDIYKTYPERIDLILMDIIMPVMSGLEAQKELTQYDPNVPILLMSAHPQYSIEGLNHPYFIVKPMRPEELFNSIHAILKNYESSCTTF